MESSVVASLMRAYIFSPGLPTTPAPCSRKTSYPCSKLMDDAKHTDGTGSAPPGVIVKRETAASTTFGAAWNSAPWPAGMKVLVVDDDPLCLKVVSQMLHKCNYKGEEPHVLVRAIAASSLANAA